MVQLNTGASATAMAQEIFGNGVTVVGASYTGDNRASGIYTQGDSQAPGVTPSDTGVILSTGQARGFDTDGIDPNDVGNFTSGSSGPNNNAQFNALAGTNTYDAAWLDIDFIPTGDTLTMQFVFASEEYPEFSNTIYNDAVGVWVNGSPADLSVGDGSTSVGNVNQVDNINLYNDNTGDAFQTEMDGFTVTLTLTMTVIPGVVNSIRIGIADVGDNNYDSNLLIAGDSLQTVLIANDDDIRLDAGTSKTLDVLGNDVSSTGATLTITHINGVAVVANQTVVLPNGQSITLNSDGTFTVLADAQQEIAPFTYTVTDGTNTDTAFVTVSTIPCFVAGTMILTPEGERPVEALQAGDLVMTQDNGPQVLRWVGGRNDYAQYDHAPIRIAAHTFGLHRTLLVSPQHRILIRDPLSELMFGDGEVLVAAKHLVNGRTVTRQFGGQVHYVHLLFDEHQVVFSEGLPSESFLPGPQTTGSFEADLQAEIAELFPALDPKTGAGYGPAARRTLKEYEAKVLFAGGMRPPETRRADREALAA
ncbi:iron-regulated protein frpC [Candidatus Rhodobacter oscarellae]|uniref:Iron-regulated protein frpC n=1 Tax=Candidatus Rhodobacter oscarellae TaxID=1675527 RepID=A0A0J9EG45_9RHOB|nr:choice-of-anchor L domain-containing protein [Candidatus Rhodobacter lobularis]KMW60634.1 iron-regulated protein frpC [Candidatus Rhodobacter lobularis]